MSTAAVKKQKKEPCPNAKLDKRSQEYHCTIQCAICKGFTMTVACPVCEGCGLVRGALCSHCHSYGRLPAS